MNVTAIAPNPMLGEGGQEKNYFLKFKYKKMYYSLMSKDGKTRYETFSVISEKEVANRVSQILYSMINRGFIKKQAIPDLKKLNPNEVSDAINTIGFSVVSGWLGNPLEGLKGYNKPY